MKSMAYSVIPFECYKCGKKLAAKMEYTSGFGKGGHQAKCPACGLVQGEFPMRVIEVLVRKEALNS